MIKNERQYRIAAAEAARFADALATRPAHPPSESGVHPLFWAAEQDAMEAQLAELRADLEAYDGLRGRRTFAVSTWADVPRALIEARIARNLTQKELGERLGLPEQAIQRYESTDYASATLERLREVAQALGVDLSGRLSATPPDPTPTKLFSRLKELGLDKRTVLEQLLPPAVAAVLAAPSKAKAAVQGALRDATNIIERIFRIPTETLFGDAPLALEAVGSAPRYKKPRVRTKKVRADAPDGYTFLAHFLGLLTLDVTSHLARRPVPRTAAEWRRELLQRYGSLNLECVLRFFWDAGIPVLPLRTGSGFHGACWRIHGREVVVLRQRTPSEDRWVFDLLHEGGHIVLEPPGESFAIIEEEVPSPEDPQEQQATKFAADVLLDGRADELAELAVERANHRVEFLEAAARRVAQEAMVPLGALANYLAFRIADDTKDEERPVNWWGSAAKLQRQTDDPWRIARDLYLAYADFGRIAPSDREILVRVLSTAEAEPAVSRRRA